MIEKNIASVIAYYTAMANKNIATMEPYLHPTIKIISPFGTTTGKEAVLKGAEQWFNFFEGLTIRTHFGSGNQVMAVIDFNCPAPIGFLRSAVLITFKDNLIASTELFHDTQALKGVAA